MAFIVNAAGGKEGRPIVIWKYGASNSSINPFCLLSIIVNQSLG